MPAPFFCALSPPHPARPTFTPRKRTGDARPQTPSARLPLSRQMQAMPASAACLPPASRRQIFCPPFPRAGCFLFVLPQMRLHSSVPRRMRERKAGQMRRGACVFPPLRPFSHCLKGLPPFFGRRKSFCLCPLLSLPHKRPPSQSKVLCPKAPRQKHDRRTRGTRRNPV